MHLNREFIGGVKHIVAKEGLRGVYQVGREEGSKGRNKMKKVYATAAQDSHLPPSLPPSPLSQGLGATIMKQGSNQGLRFMFFNEYKNWVTDNGKVSLTPLTSFLGGMSAGCFSTLCNNPLGK